MSKSLLLLLIFLVLKLNTYAFIDSTCIKFINLDEVTDPRPVLPYQIYTEHFIIHYGTETSTTYANKSAEYAEFAFEEICVSRGWRVPPPDNNRGGDNRYDIYILSTGYRGICKAEYDEQWQYEWAPSFIEIRNNLPDGLYAGDLRVVVAHEFSHAT